MISREQRKKRNEWRKWLEWYESDVQEVHKNRYIYHNGERVACNLLKYNGAQLVVKEMANYVFSEVVFPEAATEILKVDEMKKIFIDALILGQNMLLSIYDEENETHNNYLYSRTNYSFDECGVVTINANKNEYYKVLPVYEEYEQEVITFDNLTQQERTEIEIIMRPTGKYELRLYNKKARTYAMQLYDYCPYQIFQLNEDLNYTEGAAIYAYALDMLKAVDDTFTHMLNELELTSSKIVVSHTALDIDIVPPTPEELEANPNAKPKYEQYLNKQDRVFKAIKTPEGAEEKAVVQAVQMDLKSTALTDMMNGFLFALGKQTGFGNVFFRYDERGELTATGTVNSKHELWKNITAYRSIATNYVIDLIEKLTGVLLTKEDFKWGDGLITDEEALLERGLKLFNAQIIGQYEMLTEYAGYTEDDAKKVIQEQQQAFDEDITLIETVDREMVQNE